jgi:hypothetical protein
MEFLLGNYYSTLEYLDLTNTKIFFSVELVIWIFNCPKLTRLAFDQHSSLVEIPTGENLHLAPSYDEYEEETEKSSKIPPFNYLVLNKQMTAFESSRFAVEHLVWPFRFGKKLLSKILNCCPRLKTVRNSTFFHILSVHSSWQAHPIGYSNTLPKYNTMPNRTSGCVGYCYSAWPQRSYVIIKPTSKLKSLDL